MSTLGDTMTTSGNVQYVGGIRICGNRTAALKSIYCTSNGKHAKLLICLFSDI